jgi:hypothetical protein
MQMVGASPGNPAQNAPEFPGFTQIPEAMVTFYQGLEHLTAGRAAYAIRDFDIAAQSDPSFLAAFLWGARAYEALGLQTHAEVEYAKVRAAQKKFGIDWIGFGKESNSVHVVTLIFHDDRKVMDATLCARIKDGLRAERDIVFFEPDAVKSLSDERDLRLSGEFASLARLDRRAWLQSEFGVVLSSGADAIKAHVFRLLDGAALGDFASAVKDPEALCRVVAAAIRSRSSAKALATTEGVPAQDPKRISLSAPDSPDVLPTAIARYAFMPQERRRAMDLFYRYDRPKQNDHRRVLMQDLLASIRPDETNAAAWELYALNRLRDCANHLTKPESYYAGFLSAHPDTIEAACVGYMIGANYFMASKFQEARPWLAPSVERIFPLVASNESCAGAFFLPAYVEWKLGNIEGAKKFMGMVNSHLRVSPFIFNSSVPLGFEVEVGSDRPAWVPPRGIVHPTGSDTWPTLEGVQYMDMHSAYRWLDQTLQSGKSAQPTLDALYAQIRDGSSQQALDTATNYFPALITAGEAKLNEARYHRWAYVPKALLKLHRAATNDEQQAQLRVWARKVSGQSDGEEVYNMALAIGDWGWAQSLVESGKPGLLAFVCAGKIELAQRGQKAAAARYAELFDDWSRNGRDEDSCRKAMIAASALRQTGDTDRARKFYDAATATHSQFAFELSAKIELADLEREQGNTVRATELLKEVMSDEISKTARFAHIYEDFDDPLDCHGSWSGTGRTVYEESALLLKRIREAPDAAGI